MAKNHQDLDELADLARARAAFCSFLSIHFNVLPDEEFVSQMRHKDIATMLKSLQEDDSVHENIKTGASLMEKFLIETKNDPPSKLSEKLGVDRTPLYRGLSPSYGPPPPYEMVWSKTWKDTTLLEVLAGLYRENKLQPSDEIHERQDYIGIELDFLGILAAQEAAAWEAGNVEEAKSLLKTQKTFFKDHVESWVDYFIKKAFDYVKTDYYQGHLLMLRGFVKDLDQSFSGKTDVSTIS